MSRMVTGLWRALRPHQWVKNVFVLAPLVFAGELGELEATVRALLAFAAFCLTSSTVYIVNDIQDREEDRRHPLKQHRPFASGSVSPAAGLAVAGLLLLGALLLASRLGAGVTIILVVYLANNLLYSTGLKRLVILDVLLISVGFVLRVLGGGFAVGVEVSAWLLLCTIFVALLLALSKRRHELMLLADQAREQRRVLVHYSAPFLDQMVNVVTASTVMSYALYAVAPENLERFHGPYLVYTVPFVLFGIFRYLYLIYQRTAPRNPTEQLLRDAPFMINILLWGGAVLWIVYLA